MATPKLFGISGSLRKGSHNSLLLAEAARLFGEAEYNEADINLPLYNADDEEAHITENLEIRTEMVNKRLRKLAGIEKDIIPPELTGPEDYKTLIIGWGSTYNAIKEALDELGKKDLAFLHFRQIYPLYDGIKGYLEKAQKTIIIENNATSQFARLIKLQTGIEIENKILKYNGLSFSIEEVMDKISQLIR